MPKPAYDWQGRGWDRRAMIQFRYVFWGGYIFLSYFVSLNLTQHNNFRGGWGVNKNVADIHFITIHIYHQDHNPIINHYEKEFTFGLGSSPLCREAIQHRNRNCSTLTMIMVIRMMLMMMIMMRMMMVIVTMMLMMRAPQLELLHFGRP